MRNDVLINKLNALTHEHRKLAKAFDETCSNHDVLIMLLYRQILDAGTLEDVKNFVRNLSIERANKKGYQVDEEGRVVLNN